MAIKRIMPRKSMGIAQMWHLVRRAGSELRIMREEEERQISANPKIFPWRNISLQNEVPLDIVDWRPLDRLNKFPHVK